MRKTVRVPHRTAVPSVTVLLLLSGYPVLAAGPKLKPEELVALHLEALDEPVEILSRSLEGKGRFEVLVGGSGSLDGPASFISSGRMSLLDMQFDYLDYPLEQIGFDGEECRVSTVRPGVRSQLGEFIHTYNGIVKEGLFGGVLSSAWPLRDLADRRPKLSYRGLKKMRNGQKALELRYRPRKGLRDLTVYLYFDPESYRHVGTVYKLVMSAPMGRTPLESARQVETRMTLQEYFRDFRFADGTEMPMNWEIELSVEGGTGSFLARWSMFFEKGDNNPALNPGRFTLP